MTTTLDTSPLTTRMRRLRGSPQLRELVKETRLCPQDFVLPLFIHHGQGVSRPIGSLPGHSQISVDQLKPELKEIQALGIPAVILFGIPEQKDAHGSDSYSPNGVIQTAVRAIKDQAPELLVITDVCFCEYTDHGHCGVIHEQQHGWDVHNDATLELLVKQTLSHAEAGADVLAPSGMMDGMVSVMRQALDSNGYSQLPILSYAVKYCSALYGAFREAAECTPQFGNRSSYQMDPANSNEALREAELDVEEGADMLMVKPASNYLDVIYRIKTQFPELPLGGYHVSGEYAMLKAAGERGWLDEKAAALEILTGIKRAGADFMITYYAKEASRWLQESPC